MGKNKENIIINFKTNSRVTPKKKQEQSIGGYELDSLIKDSQANGMAYRSIPNNFKQKEGVAFPNTETKIKIDAGLCGIYNMGNTCFLSTGKT